MLDPARSADRRARGPRSRTASRRIQEAGTGDSVFVTDPDGRLARRPHGARHLRAPRRARRRPLAARRAPHGRPPGHLHLDQPVRRAIELMQTGRFRNVPLVDDDDVLVGVVRPVDVLKYLAEAFPEELLNLPPRPHQRMARPRGRHEHRERHPTADDHRAGRSSSSGSRSASPAIPATACSSPARSSRGTRPPSATTSAPSRTTRPRSAPRPARCPASRGFQLSFSSTDIHTPGDAPDVLVAMNPAALKANLGELPAGGALDRQRGRVHRPEPAEGRLHGEPADRRLAQAVERLQRPVSTLNSRALEGLGLTNKQVDLTKNFFALGLMFWLYERDMAATIAWIDDKFSKRPEIAEAQQARPQGRLQLRRDDRDLPRALHRPAGQARSPATTGTSPATRRRRSASWPPPSSPTATCSTARTRSRPRRTSSTSSPATRTSASRRSRPRTRSRRSAPRSARATAARWA